MNRRSLREQVFKILFRVEFNSAEEMEEQCRLFLEYEDMDISEKDGALITERFNAVQDKLDQIDSMINERTKVNGITYHIRTKSGFNSLNFSTPFAPFSASPTTL